jgi:catechol 2,3-dioxygenase-like lactoylglutathione lyase family enzyme
MRYIYCALLLTLGNLLVAQTERPSFGLSYDHTAIIVEDLDRSVAFYGQVLGLDTIYNGTKKENIRWFDLGHGTSLHVIEQPRGGLVLNKSVHLSLTAVDFDGFVAYLREKAVPFETWLGEPLQTNSRPDGARQVYLQDPDGYWIEVNDAIRLRQ